MRPVLSNSGTTQALAGPPSLVLIPATFASVGIVRAALRVALDEHDWTADPSFRVLIATTEAVANAVEHGSRPGDLIEITYQVSDLQAYVRILDCGSGTPWNPPRTPAPPPIEDERGRGLLIIATHAQQAETRRAGAGTEVRMNFSIDA